MIEGFRTHPFTRAVCLETARLFEQQAAKDLVDAQCRADDGASGEAQRLQAKARLAQQRASAWHLRAQNALDGLTANEGTKLPATFRMTQKTDEWLSAETAVSGSTNRKAQVKYMSADTSKARQ